MSETGYKIKVRKGELEVEVMGDKEFVIAKSEELIRTTFGTGAEPQPRMQPLEASLVEFLKEKNPTSHNDGVIVFAYYLHKFKGLESYNVDDMHKCYSESRTPKPRNMNVTIDNNVKRGFLASAEKKKDGKKAWTITKTGEEYVESGLKEDG